MKQQVTGNTRMRTLLIVGYILAVLLISGLARAAAVSDTTTVASESMALTSGLN